MLAECNNEYLKALSAGIMCIAKLEIIPGILIFLKHEFYGVR